MNIKQCKRSLRNKLNELEKEMGRDDYSRHIANTIIEDIQVMCKLLTNESKAISTGIMTSQAYSKISKASEIIIKRNI